MGAKKLQSSRTPIPLWESWSGCRVAFAAGNSRRIIKCDQFNTVYDISGDSFVEHHARPPILSTWATASDKVFPKYLEPEAVHQRNECRSWTITSVSLPQWADLPI